MQATTIQILFTYLEFFYQILKKYFYFSLKKSYNKLFPFFSRMTMHDSGRIFEFVLCMLPQSILHRKKIVQSKISDNFVLTSCTGCTIKKCWVYNCHFPKLHFLSFLKKHYGLYEIIKNENVGHSQYTAIWDKLYYYILDTTQFFYRRRARRTSKTTF